MIVHNDWIYIANPRTATTSIHQALRNHGNHKYLPHHTKAKEAKNYPKIPIYDWYDKFVWGFMRHPLDYFVSWYTKHPQYNREMEEISFKQFIMGHTEADSQYHYFLDHNGDNLADFIGKYENLIGDFTAVCNKIGIDARLKKLNISPIRKPKVDSEIIEFVKETFKKDFELGGY